MIAPKSQLKRSFNPSSKMRDDGRARLSLKVSFSLLFILFCPSYSFSKDINIQNLKFQQLYRIHGDYQISGAVEIGGGFYFVSDMDQDDSIYFTDLETGKVDVAYDLTKTDGYNEYRKAVRKKNAFKIGFRANDFEGISVCENPLTFYVVNERPRDVFVIKKEDEKVGFSSFSIDDPDVMAGDINAGLEGVAVDCQNKKLYVAKERDPRKIYVFSLDQIENGKSIRPEDKFDLPTKQQNISPDFADLAFSNGQLFVLERSIQQITVVNPKDKSIVARYSFSSVRDHENDDNKNGKVEDNEKGLFKTNEPYGLGEGLVIQDKTIYIFFDNNEKPLTDYAAKQYSFEKNSESVVAKFSIP